MKQYAIEFPKSYRINKFGLTLEEQDELRQAEALNASRGYNSYSKSDNVPKPIDDEIRATPLVLGMDYEAQFQKKAKELTSEKAAFTFGSVWILFFVLRYGGLLVRWAYTTSKLE